MSSHVMEENRGASIIGSISRRVSKRLEDAVIYMSNSGSSHDRSSRSSVADEEALRWAALEKLPTYNRIRTTIFKNFNISGDFQKQTQSDNLLLDVGELDGKAHQEFIDKIFKDAGEDNGKFLKKFKDRIDKVGIALPTIEVRFQNLTIEADCYIGDRALPTLLNASRNLIESILSSVGIDLSKKTKLTILKDVSGIIKPSRMTLLLGPPSSGKTTLLLALAGKLDSTLKGKEDAWIWDMAADGVFEVKRLRKVLEVINCDAGTVHIEATKWIKIVPKKVNIFVWRVLQGRIPVRVLLDQRGIDIPSILCPLCEESLENVDHILARCTIVSKVWELVFKWWGISRPLPIDVRQILEVASSSKWKKEVRDNFNAVISCFLYLIWKHRNDNIFNGVKKNAMDLFLEFQWRSFLWIKARSKVSHWQWWVWRVDPKAVGKDKKAK